MLKEHYRDFNQIPGLSKGRDGHDESCVRATQTIANGVL